MLYKLGGVVRRLILAAVSETVRNVFQFVIRHRSNKQMAVYSKSSYYGRERRRRCVCTVKND